jgi:O-methyltransferase involved in polyketide biosynthesis
MTGSETISPTAHYTGYVWARNGLSHPELETREGRLLFESLRGVTTATALLGGPSLERYLLARHRTLDRRLQRAIEGGRISQVLEVACGLSPRGWRFSSRHGAGLLYVEADLPGMAERKRAALERIGSLGPHHRVVALDALAEDGELSLSAVAGRELDPERGTVLITEGLTGYLDGASLRAMWRGFAETLERFPYGLYLSDLHLGEEQDLLIRGFRLALSAFVRGTVHLHFNDAGAARDELLACGFASASVRPALGERLVHILEASTVPA